MKKEALKHYRSAKAAVLSKPTGDRPCVCKAVVALQAAEGYSDGYISHMPAQLWEAGSDTISTKLHSFMQALLLYSEVQAKG